ncbi:DEAD/DEAH box helicase [Streptomyces sp. MnatMP-M17]|nr:DEAD/DEAH box helicase [Streptomyces sp. MnatMP-M17]
MTNADRAALRASADSVLARLVGDTTGTARLREDQWRAIEALVADRRRALVVQRTGWGKSAVYFVATSLLRERGAGPTVIVSPLLALMRNQVEAAARAGIRARTINSSNAEEWDTIQDEVAAGEVDVLLVSPDELPPPNSGSAHSSRDSAGAQHAGPRSNRTTHFHRSTLQLHWQIEEISRAATPRRFLPSVPDLSVVQ